MKISDVLNESILNENGKLKKSGIGMGLGVGIGKGKVEMTSSENVMEEFEIKSKMRKVCLGIPTKELDVKNILRLLKEPICLFGEDSYDKRKRLKSVLITKYDKFVKKKNIDNEEEVEEFKNILKRYYIDFSKLYDVNSPEYLKINELEEQLGTKRLKQQSIAAKGITVRSTITEKFYTESSEALKTARLDLTLKTLPRILLHKEMIKKFQDKFSKDEFERYISLYILSVIRIHVLTCSEDETIKFFDIETQEELFYQEGHNTNVYSATFNPYGNLYLSGDSKGGLMLWDIRTGKNIDKKKMVHNNLIMNINFNPFFPNMFCTCSADNTIKIFDLRNFTVSCNILAHNKIVTDAVFEPTYGRYITSSSFDTFIKIWDSVNFYCTKILYNNDNKVRNVDISPDGSFISSTSFDRTWKLYKNTEFAEENILAHFS
ncbi:WD domain G-beta repeat domain containing protein [Plasmodium cynomolgi strain B]|uniref:WD domain G-beta repeat domain containing protein n=1 Tax=Plasmodium cynomolgi (strain B) TaxID=1120755 RepID=K6UYH4_PLACD|nr:WD domain G-beta repeat domain containing protein [Plasmodium cynomolgi strain B]GAB67630.1 WD domain G-beta repeat domain containing protein [Plasmodium cynomolgi strain B]